MSTAQSDSQVFDVAIVGAGIIGLAVACELQRQRPQLTTVVVERETSLAAHQSSHNSGVLHTGVYYPPGSQKAQACTLGGRLMREFCERHEIAVERRGKLIVARDKSELGRLQQLFERSQANGVAEVAWLSSQAAIAEVEPHALGVAAVHSPQASVVNFATVARKLAAEFQAAGGTIRLGFQVTELDTARGSMGREVVRLSSPEGSLQAHKICGCAGLWSDRLAALDGLSDDPRIVPFRGAYLRVGGQSARLLSGMIYPVPDPSLPFLGVHLTKELDGCITIGPSAFLVAARDGYRLRTARAADLRQTLFWPGTRKLLRQHWRAARTELADAVQPKRLFKRASKYLPGLQASDLLDGFAGVRAQALGRDGKLVDDFLLEHSEHGVHLRNAPSPAATSSLALAQTIAAELLRA